MAQNVGGEMAVSMGGEEMADVAGGLAGDVGGGRVADVGGGPARNVGGGPGEDMVGEGSDAIDVIIGQWRAERPDLDLSAMGVFGRIALLSLLLPPVVEPVFERHGLNRGEFDVLTALRRSGMPYTLIPSQLSAALMMSRAGMTSRLDRLEQAGLVERRLDPADRRSFLVSLTDKGRELIDATLTEHAANLARLISPLTQEQAATLEDSLKALLRAVQQVPAPGQPTGPATREPGRSRR